MLDADNTFGTITAYCDEDGCDYEELFEGFDGHCDFSAAVKEMRENGWKIVKKNGEWFHSCPECSDKEENK